NAYSGDNGRAAVTADVTGQELIYSTGNAGNGSNPQPAGVIAGTGAQLIKPSNQPESAQTPGTPAPVGSFSVTELTAAAGSTTAGLQKWVFSGTAGQWQLAYTLQAGLNLGKPYPVRGYPNGVNSATNLPWSRATDGLRNLTGRVNPDGTVTIWAITSTVSGGGDQGADPNKLVEVTDKLSAAATTATSRAKGACGAQAPSRGGPCAARLLGARGLWRLNHLWATCHC
ncbi:MAG TPA: hypothetical protein VGG16_29360, partial [Streptosporangiaceae bacterium]